MTTTVLLADDNADNRDIYGVILEYHGYRVVHAVNGNEAVRLTREEKPDLVLMDVVMPHLDGLAATRLLKSDPLTASIPVVLLTAHRFDSDHEARASGCEAVLFKPVEPNRVVEAVRGALQARSNV
ncbi:MAG TPA: response regulator [Longimicrobium sp.]